MNSFFNIDNPFFITVGKIVDMFIISVIWVLLCLPIITAGPATTALYYVTVKVIRRERGYLLREYFRSFKANLKQGIITGLIIIALFLLLYFDRSIVREMVGTKGILLLSTFNAMMFLLLCLTIYVFPILSRFRTNIKQLLKNSLFMAIRHLPSTILLVVIVVFFYLVTYVIMPLLFITPALCCLLCSFLIERIFKKYMPEKTEDAEEAGIDEWYLE